MRHSRGAFAALGVDRGVQLGVHLECVDGCLGEERQVGELDAFTGQEVGLGCLTHTRDRRDVDLHDLGQLRRGLKRLHHSIGDDLA